MKVAAALAEAVIAAVAVTVKAAGGFVRAVSLS